MKNNKDYILTLDNNNRYVLVSNINYDNKAYIYLANIDNPLDIIIGQLIDDEITIVEDEKLLKELLKEFSKQIENNA